MRLFRQLCRYGVPAASPHIRTTSSRRPLLSLLAALLAIGAPSLAQEPPVDAVKRIAENGSRFEEERGSYTYRQSFDFYELGKTGVQQGSYREVRDVNFTTEGDRTEEFVKGPTNRLKRLIMSEEDFRDLRDVQPFALTNDTAWRYKLTYRGRESIKGRDCFVYLIEPRQVLEGQRMLDGKLWVDQENLQVVRATGQPVPQHHSTSGSNLFASFTTDYALVDGEFLFPVRTYADDYLPFPSGVQHVRYEIQFENYRRFSADATIRFGSIEIADPTN